ncbi:MAG TPA: CBS domain-containing protein [Cytophagales bacterium]|nr:CBS domain-containing protein [Cytophagales bacterium]
MIAEELINPMIPTLKPTDTVDKALDWMEEFRSNQLPVLDNSEYKGLINDYSFYDGSNGGPHISDYALSAEEVFVLPHQHFYDVIKIASDNHLEVIAVVDDQRDYKGVISVKETLLSAFAQISAVQTAGGILVLSLNENDYSLAEISRLIESNNLKILCSYVTSDDLDPLKIKLTLKLNKMDLTYAIATLERYNYKIIAKFQETDIIPTDKDRLDLLLKYLSL